MSIPDEPLSYACIFGDGTKNHQYRQLLLKYNPDDRALKLNIQNNTIREDT